MYELVNLNLVYSRIFSRPDNYRFDLPVDRTIQEIWIYARSRHNRRNGKVISDVKLRLNGSSLIVDTSAIFLREMQKWQKPDFKVYVQYRPGIYLIDFSPFGLKAEHETLVLDLETIQPGKVEIYLRCPQRVGV